MDAFLQGHTPTFTDLIDGYLPLAVLELEKRIRCSVQLMPARAAAAPRQVLLITLNHVREWGEQTWIEWQGSSLDLQPGIDLQLAIDPKPIIEKHLRTAAKFEDLRGRLDDHDIHDVSSGALIRAVTALASCIRNAELERVDAFKPLRWRRIFRKPSPLLGHAWQQGTLAYHFLSTDNSEASSDLLKEFDKAVEVSVYNLLPPSPKAVLSAEARLSVAWDQVCEISMERASTKHLVEGFRLAQRYKIPWGPFACVVCTRVALSGEGEAALRDAR